ncbi:Na+/H+ antiporter NhaC family protein [Sporomusa acidovorans]|uniref:Na+/H+ antiporter NhaC family protein n=1 Tax=Sporomusa acidovorans TaxID=112900 RepID=UPI001FDF922C|nr:Na+/H+ antiporter NhaC family protein [Sporomusa acidovorans]
MTQVGLAGNPYRIYLSAIPLNFYSISMLGISILAIFYSFQFSWLRLAQPAYKPESAAGDHDSHEAHGECHYQGKVPPRVANLLLPLAFLLALITYLFWWTGQAKRATSVVEALLSADYEKAIFVATFATLVATTLLYVLQKIPMKELQSYFLSGGTEMLPPIVILLLAWAITGVTQQLGFSTFIGGLLGNALPPQLVPVIVFALGGLASYFMGSSWGTWALVMPLALSLSVTTGANVPLTVGAVLAGGSIGDNLSPLGETPVLTSAIMDIPVTGHVS